MFNKKSKEIKEARSLALNSKIAVLAARIEVKEMDDFNNSFLFSGDENNPGIQEIIKLFLDEIVDFQGNGSFEFPTINSFIKSEWETIFNTALSNSGDDVGGLYPGGINSQDINLLSPYLNDHGYVQQSEIVEIENVRLAVSNLTTKRTESTFMPPDPDNPDYFAGLERSALINSLSTVINKINSHEGILDNIISKINDVSNDINGTLNDLEELKNDLPDAATILSHKNNLINIKNNLQGLSNYFSGFVSDSDISGQLGYNRIAFDTNLANTTSETNDLETAIFNRATSSLASLGADAESGLKKWRTFWIKSRIGKPISSLISYRGLGDALVNAEKQITEKTNELNVLFDDRNQWIPTPDVFAVYHEPLTNKEGEVLRRRIGVVFNGQQHTKKYNVFRREVNNNFSLNNNQWSQSVYQEHTSLNEQGYINFQYFDDSINENDLGKIFAYRIQAVDGDTSSLESDIINKDIFFNYLVSGNEDITYNKKIYLSSKLNILDGEHKFAKGGYIAIETNGGDEGIYLVLEKESDAIYVYPNLPINNSGKVFSISTIAAIG